jgi:lysyl endopeptidase
MREISSTAAALAIAALLSVFAVANAQAAGRSAHAASEPIVDGVTPEAYFERQEQLHAWLMSELPDGALDAPIRVPLTERDRRAIANDGTPFPRPLRVGIVKRVGRKITLWRAGWVSNAATRPAHGVSRATDDGGFAWALALDSSGATALRVQLSDISLPDSADIYFFTLDGQAHGPYRGRNAFWSNSVMGEQGILLVRQFGPPSADASPMTLSVASVGNIGEQFAAAPSNLCSYNASCIEDAEGVNSQPAADLKAATAYIEWTQGPWIYSCSGGLLADTDPNSQIPYFLTANHCLKSNATAASLELFWNYTTSNGSCNGPGTPVTMGGTVKATGVKGDFTLLQLNQSPPAGSVFMGWNNQQIATTSGVTLHRVHHPGGAPQSYSTHVTDANTSTCGGWPIPQSIYSVDAFGSTEGGSSGSLVANDAGQVVGQLSGGCGSNLNDVCDAVNNRTVDGAFAFYYANVATFLGASCSPSPEVCTDGADNDCDTAVDCIDSDCTSHPACQSACAPKNAACGQNSDCCSMVCKPNGRCR